MNKCRICNKLIWPWQMRHYKLGQIRETGEYIEFDHAHANCRDYGMTLQEKELLR